MEDLLHTMSMCHKCKPILEMIQQNLRMPCGGADIHEVDTMRHIAGSLIALIDKGIQPDFVCKETKLLQDRSVAYFKKKFCKIKH